VKAYKRLKEKQGHKIKLIMVGDGPMTETLKKEVDSAVIFTGYQTGEALKEYYALSDIFVFPSTTETLGNVVLEAMASGLPVVGAKAGGVKDNIIHGYNGLLSLPRDDQTFYENVDKLIETPELRNKMANKYAQDQANSSLGGGKQCPVGTHKAMCVQIVDQGTKEGAYGTYYSYRFVFEVKDKQDPDNPFLIAEQVILSLSPKAPLRKMLATISFYITCLCS